EVATQLCMAVRAYAHRRTRDLPSFPTRRSSDLGQGFARHFQRAPGRIDIGARDAVLALGGVEGILGDESLGQQRLVIVARARGEDRKSTRLNSSHVKISYAVFCLKKKTPRRDQH